MKRIAYIELDTHAQIAANFLELMENSTEFDVDFFFSPKIYRSLGKSSPNICKVSPANIISKLDQGNYDIVIIGTAHRYFNLFLKITQKFKTSVVVHNLNFAKISKIKLLQNIFKKDTKYRLKLLLKESLLSAPEIYRKASHLLVLDKNMEAGNTKYLPVFFTKYQQLLVSEVCTVVIPGAVSQQRRNYLYILKKLRDFQSEAKFLFVFLGKASGVELRWLEKFKQNKPQNISLKFFTEKVPQPLFDEWMNRADVLWCPVQSETEFFSQKEIYGKTKMSGNVGDATKYGKKALFPSVFSGQNPFVLGENEHIESQFLTIKAENEIHFKDKFSNEKVRNELEKVIYSLF